MKQVIIFLYNRIDAGGAKYKDGDLDLYAAIGSFLTDENAFKAAIKQVEIAMALRLKETPSNFEVTTSGGVYVRQVALGPERRQAGHRAQAKAELERTEGQGSILLQAMPKQLPRNYNDTERLAANAAVENKIKQRTDVIDDKEKQFLQNHPGFFHHNEGKDVVVRKFHFHKLLRELEKKYGFVDKGLILMGNLDGPRFAQILSQGEVWKDSIAATHGEYTHRLQWLAVANHFNFSKEDVLRLYRGSSNQIRSKYSEHYELTRLPNTEYAGSLWNFLFDCFAQSEDAKVIWDGTTNAVDLRADRRDKVLAEDEKVFLNTLRACGRSDSFRSPLNVTNLLRTDAGMGLLHAYIASSQIKTPVDKNLNAEPLPVYRRARLADKYPDAYQEAEAKKPATDKKLLMFVPPVSTSISTSQII